MNEIVFAICVSTLVAATPILYACLGEIITERAGIINLGLEGIMLMGAAIGWVALVNTGSLLLSILAVIFAGAVLGLLYAFFTVTLQANQTVCGLAIVTFGGGLSGFLANRYSSEVVTNTFKRIAIPGLSNIPVIGPILFKQDLMVYALYILVPLLYFYIFKTRSGLKLRSLGESPGTLDAVGANVYGLQYIYIIVGSMLVALGGAYLTLAYTPSWQDGITAGRGWIASALVIFSTWNPAIGALGALLFGFISILSLSLQAIGINAPSYFINMLPYICTILVLVLSTGNFRKKIALAPAALGTYYDREER